MARDKDEKKEEKGEKKKPSPYYLTPFALPTVTRELVVAKVTLYDTEKESTVSGKALAIEEIVGATATVNEANGTYTLSIKPAADATSIKLTVKAVVPGDITRKIEIPLPAKTTETSIDQALRIDESKIADGHYRLDILFGRGKKAKVRVNTDTKVFNWEGVDRTEPFDIDVPPEGKTYVVKFGVERLILEFLVREPVVARPEYEIDLVGPKPKPPRLTRSVRGLKRLTHGWE